MKINSLEKAESLVSNNSKLSWNGWDIEYLYQDDNAFMKTSGVFKDDRWHIKEIFRCVNGQWDIPDNIVKEKYV